MQNANQVYKLLLLLLVIFLAPFWIPIGVAFIATTIMMLGGMLTIFCVPTSVILFVLAIFAIPLLFSIGVPAMTQLSLKLLQHIQYLSGVDLSRWLPFTKTSRQSNEVQNSEADKPDIEIKDSWDAFA
jgi:energy-coupling factor transporter transmembrane protein EcfT